MEYLVFITPMNMSQISLALLMNSPVNSVLSVEPTDLLFLLLFSYWLYVLGFCP